MTQLASRARHAAYAALTVFFSLSASLAGVEFVLAWQAKRIQAAERMAPGFLLYDSLLGWRLAPEWRGRHLHYDFDVHYATNYLGPRGPWPGAAPGRRRHALLGDSFTFGLGVNDGETFAAKLNQLGGDAVFLNIGVPGYSTDQEYLYLRDHLTWWRAGEVSIVVCLANDLFDNTLARPLQADMEKPYFALEGGGLALRNVPVPPKPPTAGRPSLAAMVLGEARARALAGSPLSRYELPRRLGLSAALPAGVEQEFPARFAHPLALFYQLVEAAREICARQGVALNLVLLPGQSFIEQPGSYSASFQDYLRRAIVAERDRLHVPVIDLAARLREKRPSLPGPLFHPHEGHFNAAGHQAVAELLREELSRRR